jgi:hypothetical protein
MSMSKISSLGAASALALAFAFAPAQAAPAAPASVLAGISKDTAGDATQVRYRRGWHGGRRWGAAPWLGLGAGVIIGSIIANEAYRPRRGYYYDDYEYDGPYYYPSNYQGDPRVVCAESFRSFEWRTGLYTTYSGEKRLCPYLR